MSRPPRSSRQDEGAEPVDQLAQRVWSIEIPFDTTLFVEASIAEVYETLFVAVALVVIVIFIFLQDWRATIVPVVAIPVSLIGTFAVMSAIGFSINMLSLFGVVLAIGIVVDDAIVVVENTTRHLADGLSPKDAAVKAMSEITGPVIATTLVLAGRVCSQRVHGRNHRPTVPAICADHLRRGPDQHRQRPDDEPGAVRHCLAARPRIEVHWLPPVQSRLSMV